MQPYQQASAEIQEQNAAPGQFLRKAASTALGLAGGSAAWNKIAPLVSNYVPQKLAQKGLSKISPWMGKLIAGAEKHGYSFDDIRNFLREKGEKEEQEQSNALEQKQKAQDQRGIVEKYSPELHSFILQEIKKGKSPIQAATDSTRGNPSFTKLIKKITQDYRMPWSAIVESVYGTGVTSKQAAAKKYNQRQKQGLMQQEQERFNQTYGDQEQQNGPDQAKQVGLGQPPQQQKIGPGQQALMGLLQQINQKLGQQ